MPAHQHRQGIGHDDRHATPWLLRRHHPVEPGPEFAVGHGDEAPWHGQRGNEHGAQREAQHAQVAGHRRVVHIVERIAQLGRQDDVDILALGVAGAREQGVLVAVAQRGEVGDARAHAEHALARRGRIVLDVARHLGPRPDQAHAAAQHVDQLRQFVELGAAQQRAHAGDARIAGHGELRAGRSRQSRHSGRVVHRAELEDAKRLPITAYTHLTEKHRPLRIEPDQQRHHQQQRRKQQQAECGGGDVERSLQHAMNVSAARPSTLRSRARHRHRSYADRWAG